MKRTILLLVALSLLGTASLPAATRQTSSSAEKQSPADTTKKIQLSERARQMVERRLDRLNQVLSLTPEQQKKIRGILEKAALELEPANHKRPRDMSPEERRQFREKLRSQREQTNKEIEKVLNPEQVKKFRDMLKQQKFRRGRSMRRPH